MIQDIMGVLYLFWPITITASIVFFLAGFLFAISLGGLVAIGLLIGYYTWVYLKKKGLFSWLEKKHKIVGEKLRSHIRETFVLKGHLEELPSGPVLYVAHPHGLFSMAPFLHWAAEMTSWPGARKVHIAIHSIFFQIPVVRELCEYFGAIEATDEEISEKLKAGDSVALLTGGVREISATEPGRMKIFLKKRKGFARVAREFGVPIVPVLTFGENELFPPVEGFWTDKFQGFLRSWLGLAIPLPTFQSFKNWFGLLQGPLQPPVETWIGAPIATKLAKNLQEVREAVFKGFEALYQEGRPTHYPEGLEIL